MMDECKVCANNGNEYCFVCDEGDRFEPIAITNGDRFRAMTDYDLADWIAKVLFYHGIYVRSVHEDCNHECPLYKCCNDQPSDNIEDWLKSPVEVSE